MTMTLTMTPTMTPYATTPHATTPTPHVMTTTMIITSNDNDNHTSDVSVEVVFPATSFACTYTKLGIMSNDNTWVGLGNGRDVLVGNEYKSAEDRLDFLKKVRKNRLYQNVGF